MQSGRARRRADARPYGGRRHMKKLKFVIEKHRDGYVAYPLGLRGAVVGEGETSESALADAKSAAAFHIKSFGKEAFDDGYAVDYEADPQLLKSRLAKPQSAIESP